MGRGVIGALVGFLAVAAIPGPAAAQDVGELFARINPSVVVIRAKGRDVTTRGVGTFAETGSGVLVSADGHVMTAAHVVSSEPAADLSLLQLARVPAGAKVAPLGDSDKVRVGEQVAVVGAPYGLSYSLSVGWISAKWPANTVYKSLPLAEFFQTNATINTGNSGGPMFNMAGEVIGIVSHIISKSGGNEGLGFVVTMKTARQILIEHKSVWGGLEGTLLTGELADIFNVPGGAGYLVKTVAKDSPAWHAGVLGGDRVATINGQDIVVRGDIILDMDGIRINSIDDLPRVREKMAEMKSGTAVKITVLRAGKVVELTGKIP